MAKSLFLTKVPIILCRKTNSTGYSLFIVFLQVANMKLKTKVPFALIIAIAIFAVAASIIQQQTMKKSFLALEDEHTSHEVERCLNAVEQRIQAVAAITLDWGSWDDLWTYMHDRNETFHESNLVAKNFNPEVMEFLFLYDNNNGPLYLSALDPNTSEVISAAEISNSISS